MKQSELFGDKDDELDEATYVAPVHHPDPDRIRARLQAILSEAKAATVLPWNAREVSVYRTIFPQMTRALPEDEAAQLRFAFEEEMVRLKAA